MDAADRGHLAEAIGEVVELLDAVGQPYGELLGEELRGTEEGTCDTTHEPSRCRRQCSSAQSNDTIQSHGPVQSRMQLTDGGLLAKLDHLPEGDTGRGEVGEVSDPAL